MLNAARDKVEMAAYNRMKAEEDLNTKHRKQWIVLGTTLAAVNAVVFGLAYA